MFFRFLADLSSLDLFGTDRTLKFRGFLNINRRSFLKTFYPRFIVRDFRFHLASGVSSHHHEDCRPDRAEDGNPAK